MHSMRSALELDLIMPTNRSDPGGLLSHASWAATARCESSRGTGIRESQAYVILPVFTLRSAHGD